MQAVTRMGINIKSCVGRDSKIFRKRYPTPRVPVGTTILNSIKLASEGLNLAQRCTRMLELENVLSFSTTKKHLRLTPVAMVTPR